MTYVDDRTGPPGTRRRLVHAARRSGGGIALALLSILCPSAAHATTYRCDVAGHVTYSDSPCPAGTQAPVASAPPVDPEARAAAAARLRSDQATLDRLERERQQDSKAAALARRRGGDLGRHAQACAKLARRARDAHDAVDLAGPRAQPKDRLKMLRADQDYATLCKR